MDGEVRLDRAPLEALPYLRRSAPETVPTMRARLDDERLDARWAKGAALSDSEAVAFAWEYAGGGQAPYSAQAAVRSAN